MHSTKINLSFLIAASALILVLSSGLDESAAFNSYYADLAQSPRANPNASSDSRALLQANACAPGFGALAVVQGTPACAMCPPGYYSRGGVGAKCVVCDQYSYSVSSGSAACTACPMNQWVGSKGSPQAICVCMKKFYFAFYREASLKQQTQPSRSEIEQTLGTFSVPSPDFCIPCPDGAKCSGSYDVPRPTPGFWANQSDPVSIVFCTWNKDACLGNFSCLPHHSGPLCGQCEPNYFMRSGTCSKCSLSSRIIILYIILLGIGGGAIFAWLVKVQSTFVIISSVQYFQVLTILNRSAPHVFAFVPRRFQPKHCLTHIALSSESASRGPTISPSSSRLSRCSNFPCYQSSEVRDSPITQAINFNPSVLQLECDNAGVNNDYQNFIIMMLIGISVGIL